MNENVLKIINDWNPAEIYPLLYKEYEIEVDIILYLIKSSKSKLELSKQIYNLFEHYFGTEFHKSQGECEMIAEMLIEIK
ncbi:DUF1871 family protein [Paenibacillus sp. PsM32]|uniref:DUF1871 family protein n=1 Tax=Paenibacillus sp. PsM32 TaxID=3030536 RepID=UPI00263A7257|nr:DUF1871 family protein [Paenibacillus sp. PsM32]MDN4619079.1 DUF1871 family protein [Paenibacillus sp. PsM32]